jgi:predicted nucleic acid-binding protein
LTIVDSCGWLELAVDGPLADAYQAYLDLPDLLVPSIVIHEVYKVLLRTGRMEVAEATAMAMQECGVAELDAPTALCAADTAIECRLATADAIIYATALIHDALLVTSDAHFQGLPRVEFITPSQDTPPPPANP